MHSRIAVHEVSFPDTMDVGAILDWAASHRIANVGLFSLRRQGAGWDQAIAAVASSPVSIAYLCHASMFTLEAPDSWAASSRSLMTTIDAAAAMNSPLVYATTGPAGQLEFDEAVEALTSAIQPALEHARSRGVTLLTETANPLFRFTHFLHSFQDTIDAAAAAGIGLCLDLHPTWHERGIRNKIRTVAGAIKLVQVSDYIPRNMTVARDIVGDGIIPMERLLGTLFEAGYDGVVDLELFGRPKETALNDILRSTENLGAMLRRLGVAG